MKHPVAVDFVQKARPTAGKRLGFRVRAAAVVPKATSHRAVIRNNNRFMSRRPF